MLHLLSRCLLLGAIAAALASCRGKPGDDCTDAPGSCSDKASHLACSGGKYVLETCKGKGGCTDDKSLFCDTSLADVGDGCGHEGARACSSDGSKELRCRDRKFSIEWSCRGGFPLRANNKPKGAPPGEVGDAWRPHTIACGPPGTPPHACARGQPPA